MFEYLDRTLRLMRDLVVQQIDDAILLDALVSTRVVVAADLVALRSHAARAALATVAQLAARSGAMVFVDAPNVPLEYPLPPLRGGRLLDALEELGHGLLSIGRVGVRAPAGPADVVILIGDSVSRPGAELTLRMSADDKEGAIACSSSSTHWSAGDFPLGALAAAGLAAAEVFKSSLRKLRPYAQNLAVFDELLAPVSAARLSLQCPRGVASRDLGSFDVVSGGAIGQALLYCLAQIPGVRGSARVIEPDQSEASNMNRCMLLFASELGRPKAESLAGLDLGNLYVEPAPVKFDDASLAALLPLRDRVLVGVDHIPSRWFTQAQWPTWLGIGATSHYAAMSSWHAAGAGCARCLHPRDEAADAPLPTAAFVSFLAGLSLAARLVDAVQGGGVDVTGQQEWLDTLRLDSGVWRTPVAMRRECPLNCSAKVNEAA